MFKSDIKTFKMFTENDFKMLNFLFYSTLINNNYFLSSKTGYENDL